jgi:cytochrome c oxidase assembly factor CtaG
MTTHDLFVSTWRLDPLAAVACIGGAAIYVLTRREKGGNAFAFFLALLALAFVLASPVGVLADGYLFSAHMLQHLVLVLIVPPLALLGLPRMELPRLRRTIDRVPMRAPIAWGLGVGAMWLWHAPSLCNAASQSEVMLRVQEVSLLTMGVAFWWPVLGPKSEARLSAPAGIVYLFTACSACTLLGIYVTFSPVELCSVFLHPNDRLGVMPLLREQWGLSAQRDQQIGGLLMWVPACLVYGVGILSLVVRLMKGDEETAMTTTTKEAA